MTPNSITTVELTVNTDVAKEAALRNANDEMKEKNCQNVIVFHPSYDGDGYENGRIQQKHPETSRESEPIVVDPYDLVGSPKAAIDRVREETDAEGEALRRLERKELQFWKQNTPTSKTVKIDRDDERIKCKIQFVTGKVDVESFNHVIN